MREENLERLTGTVPREREKIGNQGTEIRGRRKSGDTGLTLFPRPIWGTMRGQTGDNAGQYGDRRECHHFSVTNQQQAELAKLLFLTFSLFSSVPMCLCGEKFQGGWATLRSLKGGFPRTLHSWDSESD